MSSISLLLSYLSALLLNFFPLVLVCFFFWKAFSHCLQVFYTKWYKKLYKWKDYANCTETFVLTLLSVKRGLDLTFLWGCGFAQNPASQSYLTACNPQTHFSFKSKSVNYTQTHRFEIGQVSVIFLVFSSQTKANVIVKVQHCAQCWVRALQD